jgi:peptidoglycan hydrolase CwlO-like protein
MTSINNDMIKVFGNNVEGKKIYDKLNSTIKMLRDKNTKLTQEITKIKTNIKTEEDKMKAEAPATEAPATEAPATEAPATEAPATEAPVTKPETVTTEPVTKPIATKLPKINKKTGTANAGTIKK